MVEAIEARGLSTVSWMLLEINCVIDNRILLAVRGRGHMSVAMEGAAGGDIVCNGSNIGSSSVQVIMMEDTALHRRDAIAIVVLARHTVDRMPGSQRHREAIATELWMTKGEAWRKQRNVAANGLNDSVVVLTSWIAWSKGKAR